MKKAVRFGFILVIVSFLAYGAHAAEEPTYMDQIQAGTKVITEATERLKKNKDDVDAYYARGGAYLTLGQIYTVLYTPSRTAEQNKLIKDLCEKAVTDFTTVIELRPALTQAFIMRGMAYGQMGLSHAAIADYTRVIEVDKKNASAYYARGREYWEMGDYLKAKEDYDRAVELDPQWKDNFYK